MTHHSNIPPIQSTHGSNKKVIFSSLQFIPESDYGFCIWYALWIYLDGTCIHKHKATTLWTNTVYSNTSSSKLAFCERVWVYVCMPFGRVAFLLWKRDCRHVVHNNPVIANVSKWRESEQGKHRHFVDTVTLKIKNPHKNNVRSLESQKRTTHSHRHWLKLSLSLVPSFSPTLFLSTLVSSAHTHTHSLI